MAPQVKKPKWFSVTLIEKVEIITWGEIFLREESGSENGIHRFSIPFLFNYLCNAVFKTKDLVMNLKLEGWKASHDGLL